MLPNIRRRQECFRARGLPVIFCAFGSFLENGQDLPQWLKDFDHLGSSLFGHRVNPAVNDPNWQVDERVAPRPGELVLNKNTSGPSTPPSRTRPYTTRGLIRWSCAG